jgi:tetratricopeptide (TPR) repeat protein
MQKKLKVLIPWCLSIESNDGSVNTDQGNLIFRLLSHTECSIAEIYTNRNELEAADNYCQRALPHARRCEGDFKVTALSMAFKTYCQLRMIQNNYVDAITYAEEGYNLVAEAYNPVHPKVQLAASILIECLVHTGDLEHAQIFAQMTLDSLRDPANGLDQNSEEVANGYYDLGNVTNIPGGDFVKAEKLARESYRIRILLYHKDHENVGLSVSLLASTLLSQVKLGDETKELFDRSLAIAVMNYGLDAKRTAVANDNLGSFHDMLADRVSVDRKKKHLHLAESFYIEALRIYTKLCGPDYPPAINIVSFLSSIALQLSQP